MRRCIPLFLAAVLVATVMPPAAAAGEPSSLSPEEVREIARAVTADSGYQKEIHRAPQKDTVELDIDVSAGSFLLPLLYVAIGVAGALVLLWAGMYIHEQVLARFAARTKAPEDVDGIERKDPHMSEVDRLAGAGRYGEAVHALLLLAVARLSAACGRPVADALTGRELARRLPRSPEERGLFELLVKAVEVSFFGNCPVDREAFTDCREAFRKLAP